MIVRILRWQKIWLMIFWRSISSVPFSVTLMISTYWKKHSFKRPLPDINPLIHLLLATSWTVLHSRALCSEKFYETWYSHSCFRSFRVHVFGTINVTARYSTWKISKSFKEFITFGGTINSKIQYWVRWDTVVCLLELQLIWNKSQKNTNIPLGPVDTTLDQLYILSRSHRSRSRDPTGR